MPAAAAPGRLAPMRTNHALHAGSAHGEPPANYAAHLAIMRPGPDAHDFRMTFPGLDDVIIESAKSYPSVQALLLALAHVAIEFDVPYEVTYRGIVAGTFAPRRFEADVDAVAAEVIQVYTGITGLGS